MRPARCWRAAAHVGVLGVLPGIMGVLQATEAIKRILGLASRSPAGSWSTTRSRPGSASLRLRRDPACPTCGDGVDRSQIPLIDYEQFCAGPGRHGGELADDNRIMHSVIMIRTQVSLTPGEMRAARAEAKRLGISLAELLRRSLRSLLPVEASKPWMRFAGMIESGDAESSRRIDDVIYGQKD